MFIKIFKLGDSKEGGSTLIENAIVTVTIPSEYSFMLAVGINEKHIESSVIALKQKDFKNIDIATVEFL